MEKGIINRDFSLLLMGGSAGSLEVILQLLPQLPKNLYASVVIILHRKNDDSLLAKLLSGKTSLPVMEAEDKDLILPGTIYIAPPDYHLLIEKDRTFSLDYSEKVNYCRPSIDVSFETASDAYGKEAVAILLSGANADGAEGLLRIREEGGFSIAQDISEAIVDFMPNSAIRAGAVDAIMKLEEMKKWLSALPAKGHHTFRGQESP